MICHKHNGVQGGVESGIQEAKVLADTKIVSPNEIREMLGLEGVFRITSWWKSKNSGGC